MGWLLGELSPVKLQYLRCCRPRGWQQLLVVIFPGNTLLISLSLLIWKPDGEVTVTVADPIWSQIITDISVAHSPHLKNEISTIQ